MQGLCLSVFVYIQQMFICDSLCNASNEIDDEIHLLLHCNVMNNKREILLNFIAGIINMQPTNDIFLRIMTSRDITVVKSLAKFIYGCFKQK